MNTRGRATASPCVTPFLESVKSKKSSPGILIRKPGGANKGGVEKSQNPLLNIERLGVCRSFTPYMGVFGNSKHCILDENAK